MRLFSRLTKKISDVYRQISGGEVLKCSYESSLGDNLTQLSRDELADVFVGNLLAARDVDLRRQQTTIGPHRDDIIFEIDGHDARVFGSQGQQRSVVLALKMAEVLLAAEILGEQPLLLLDDVMLCNASFLVIFSSGVLTIPGIIILTIILTFLLLLFGEIIPKTYSEQRILPFCRFAAPIIKALEFVFYPIVAVMLNSPSQSIYIPSVSVSVG